MDSPKQSGGMEASYQIYRRWLRSAGTPREAGHVVDWVMVIYRHVCSYFFELLSKVIGEY